MLGKARQMRNARQVRCAEQHMVDEQGKAGNMRETWQGRCARQGRADARG
jgi:hypothetical protein